MFKNVLRTMFALLILVSASTATMNGLHADPPEDCMLGDLNGDGFPYDTNPNPPKSGTEDLDIFIDCIITGDFVCAADHDKSGEIDLGDVNGFCIAYKEAHPSFIW